MASICLLFLLKREGIYAGIFSKTGKYHIDLWEANRIELLNAGVPAEQIEVAGICSYIHHDEFFSARRLGIDSGRTLSGIMIRKESNN